MTNPISLLEPWPQESIAQHAGIGHELVLALNAPLLQMIEEVNDVLLAPFVCLEQAIVPEIPEVPVPSLVGRAAQPMDVEQQKIQNAKTGSG